MCIIQNDRNDWKIQSAQMGHIYSNATLTISAATGEDSYTGLFVDRDPRKTHPCTLNWQCTDKNGVATMATFLACQDLENEKLGHLDTRGWTFQEMYLPTRTLRFSQAGMHWICASNNASEGLPMGQQPLNHESDYRKYIKRNENGVLAIQVDSAQRYKWWYRAIEKSSHRANLTGLSRYPD